MDKFQKIAIFVRESRFSSNLYSNSVLPMFNLSPLPLLVHEQARVYGEKVALRYRNYKTGLWGDVSWNQFSGYVSETSAAMLALGIAEQENVAVFSQNMPECLYCDFGAYGIRAITIPFYATSSEMQIKYMISDASIRFVFVGEQYQYDTAFRVLQMGGSLERLIIFDRNVQKNQEDHTSLYFNEFLALGRTEDHKAEIERRTKAVQPEDIANILYTSGTTGLSKGVMLTHLMYNTSLKAHEGLFPLTEDDEVLNFLPFTHVFERTWSYICIACGCTLAVNLRPADVLQSMREIHPTCMCSVPRFWEKVYHGLQDRMEKSTPMQHKLMEEALTVGRHYIVKFRMRGLIPPLSLKMKYQLYEKTVLSMIKKELGLERANIFPTAGAAIPCEVEEFVHSIGIKMITGYGLTESTATVTGKWLDKPATIGSVGRLLPGVELRFGENNEILLKGDTITKGYYRKAEVTDLSIDSEGWFHTGDAGYVKDGELFLTERIKDMFKTSNGKYIAPQLLESKFSVDKFIDQIVIIADERKFVSALVVPEYDALADFLKKFGCQFSARTELCQSPQAIDFMMFRINTLQQEFASYEQVKKITLLPEPFSLERGELTNTLKVKRSVLNEHYKTEIEKMYDVSAPVTDDIVPTDNQISTMDAPTNF